MLGMSMGDPQRYPHGTHEYYDHPQQMDMRCCVFQIHDHKGVVEPDTRHKSIEDISLPFWEV